MLLRGSGGGSAASPSRTSGSPAWTPLGSQQWRSRESKFARRSEANGWLPAALSPNCAEFRSAGRPTICSWPVARADLPYLTTRDLIAVATGQGSVQERALALWYPSEQIDAGRASRCGAGNPGWCSTTYAKPDGLTPSSKSRTKGSGALAKCCARSSRSCPASITGLPGSRAMSSRPRS